MYPAVVIARQTSWRDGESWKKRSKKRHRGWMMGASRVYNLRNMTNYFCQRSGAHESKLRAPLHCVLSGENSWVTSFVRPQTVVCARDVTNSRNQKSTKIGDNSAKQKADNSLESKTTKTGAGKHEILRRFQSSDLLSIVRFFKISEQTKAIYPGSDRIKHNKNNVRG